MIKTYFNDNKKKCTITISRNEKQFINLLNLCIDFCNKELIYKLLFLYHVGLFEPNSRETLTDIQGWNVILQLDDKK